jgi:hypothetical protein
MPTVLLVAECGSRPAGNDLLHRRHQMRRVRHVPAQEGVSESPCCTCACACACARPAADACLPTCVRTPAASVRTAHFGGQFLFLLLRNTVRCKRTQHQTATCPLHWWHPFTCRFNKLYTLEGGIQNYMREEGLDHWNGSLFVFDGRMAIRPSEWCLACSMRPDGC